jgi:transcriptional regulator with XRE-family HTH domain
MAKSFNTLKMKMSPESLERATKKAQDMLSAMPLQELRKARVLSQEQLARALHLRQPSISKLEKRTDMYISTLRSFIKAMGGELEIVARFPEGSVRINQFEEIEDSASSG